MKNERLTVLSAVEKARALRYLPTFACAEPCEPMFTAQAHTRPAQIYARARRPTPAPAHQGAHPVAPWVVWAVWAPWAPCGLCNRESQCGPSFLLATRLWYLTGWKVALHTRKGFLHGGTGYLVKSSVKLPPNCPVLGCVDF